MPEPLTLEMLRAELQPLRTEIATIRTRVDGLPLIGRRIEAMEDTLRIRATMIDFSRKSVTAGEVEALNQDVTQLQADKMELERRLVTIERLLHERGIA